MSLLFRSYQDLAVSVRATGKVLLNYVSGRVGEGLYAVMVRCCCTSALLAQECVHLGSRSLGTQRARRTQAGTAAVMFYTVRCLVLDWSPPDWRPSSHLLVPFLARDRPVLERLPSLTLWRAAWTRLSRCAVSTFYLRLIVQNEVCDKLSHTTSTPQVSGYMHINGKNFTRNDLKKIAAYVPQDDILK